MSKVDDEIMEITVKRGAMLSADYYLNSKTYMRYFRGGGVTLKTTFKSVGTSNAF